MRPDRSYALILAAGFALAGPCRAQSSTTPTPQHPIDIHPEGQRPSCSYSASRTNGATTSNTNCPANDTPSQSTAKRFPYPGEAPADPSAVPTSPTPSPAGSDSKSSTQQPQSTTKRFPYPGDSQAPAQNPPLADAGSSGESTSSSSSSSVPDGAVPPDDDETKSPDALPAPKRARKKLPPVPRQTPDEREQEDVRVATFYQNDGNYRAAYMRAKDAVALTEDDADAQFALAEAARKLGKLDEAEKSYKRCLELDPVPKLRKASERALKEMSGA